MEKQQKGKHVVTDVAFMVVCRQMLLWRCDWFVSTLTELEKQMKIENLFVTWQQRSAQSNMPISVSPTRLWKLIYHRGGQDQRSKVLMAVVLVHRGQI